MVEEKYVVGSLEGIVGTENLVTDAQELERYAVRFSGLAS